jgi:AraC-like DNA-binding protein
VHAIPRILQAQAVPHVEVLFRESDDSALLLRRLLREAPAEPSIRATALHALSPVLGRLPADLAREVLALLFGSSSGMKIDALLRQLRIRRRRFERRLLANGLSTVNTLLHLGRILTAFECIARRRQSIDAAAEAVGYRDGRGLWLHCRRYMRCAPSEFTTLPFQRVFTGRLLDAVERRSTPVHVAEVRD